MAKKNINPRCPLSGECERKQCEHINHELDCEYYEANGWGDNSIPDQDELRKEKERKRDEAMYEAELAGTPDEALPNETAIGQLVSLSVDRLHPHPDNPRKDLGDLSELADSIKANGIFQNLTVVPDDPTSSNTSFTVIIGHRRLAAAKLAGLPTVPCVVTEMTEKEQLQTMLMENMQRSDLTVYEQAQGFQMMLDLGSTVEEIAETSGFSQTTVRRRVKLLDLDRNKFKKATERGATLFDFMELDKIKSPEKKNEVLSAIGTNNFRQRLQEAIDTEKREEFIADAVAAVSPYAEKIDKADYSKMTYVRGFNRWNMNNGISLPDDIESAKYYYVASPTEVGLYRDKANDPVDAEAEARRAAEAERQARYDQLKAQLSEITTRHFRLRKAFIKGFGAAKKNIGVISKYAAIALMVRDGDISANTDYETLAELLERDFGDEEVDIKTISEMFEERPEYALLATVFCELDDESSGYWDSNWSYVTRRSEITHDANENLSVIYDLLQELGYEVSDEEMQMMNGSHPLFAKEEEPSLCDVCKSAHPTCDKCCASCDEPCNAAQECRKKEVTQNG